MAPGSGSARGRQARARTIGRVAVLTELSVAWCARAQELAPYAPAAAEAFRVAAAELKVALMEEGNEELNLERAAAESNYSTRRLRELLASGALPNAGKKGRPRIKRADLPKRTKATAVIGYDAVADAARIVRGTG